MNVPLMQVKSATCIIYSNINLFQITFLILLTRYTLPNYGDGYDYPTHSIAIAVGIGMSPIIIMVAIATKEMLKTRGSLRKVNTLIMVAPYHRCKKKII